MTEETRYKFHRVAEKIVQYFEDNISVAYEFCDQDLNELRMNIGDAFMDRDRENKKLVVEVKKLKQALSLKEERR